MLNPNDFDLKTNTTWSFPNHGKWATHNSKYRGNWSPYIPRNIIMRYSSIGDIVLDQFVGGGTTAIEAKLTNRNCIAFDINPDAVELTKKKLCFESDTTSVIKVNQGDARQLKGISNEQIDLICTHPPYSNIVQYSKGIDGDLSLLSIEDYLLEMGKVASECYRVLKYNKYCSILIGDMRIKGMVYPLGFKLMQVFENNGFKLKEIIIKEQHNCKMTGFWKSNSIKHNFLLLSHEYLFVFKK